MQKTIQTMALALVVYSGSMAQDKIKYPLTEKVNVTDDYFGVKIEDPYRWMEYDTAANVKAWVEAENKITFDYLSKIPYREKMKQRMTELLNYPRYGSPFRVGKYYFFSKNDGLQNQNVIYIQKGINGEPEVFIDPNTMLADGTAAVGLLGASKDHRYMAYSVSKAGSDWREIFVMEIATRKVLNDKLEWVKFSGAAWKDNGFYYSRYDAPKDGKLFSGKNEFHKVYYHKLGTPQTEDQLIYEDKANPNRYFGAGTTEDERFLIINVSSGTDGTELYSKDLTAGDKEFALLFPGFTDNASVITNLGDKLLLQTDLDAPNQKIVLVDPKNPGKQNWKTVVAETKHLMDAASTAGGKLFVTYLKDVSSHCYQFTLNGKEEHQINLPGIGTAGVLGGNFDDKDIFYSYTSFNYPPTIFKYNIASGKSEVWQKPGVRFNPTDFETKQVFYKSKDGTQVPMFLVYKKGIKLDGGNPTLLYGYGGFNITLTPSFSTTRMVFLENGGVYAMANIRGGGEYGDRWHEDGRLFKKQNVFDDFIAAAEWLIQNKYTSKKRLAIQGGSNGGLLVGACMTQRPDLFKVCIPQVGVMDMLRYHKFTVGWGWAVEYGSSDSLEYFRNLLAYSPLHNIKPNIDYPATLITTADHDDRVVPAHSFKFAATLQEKTKGTNPALIRIDVRAGHGAGKPTTKVIEEQADIYSFIFYNMDHIPTMLK